MSSSIINISEVFSAQSLVTRQAARDLFEIVVKNPNDNIILDFTNIDYASRSFFDELNSFEKEYKSLGKKVEMQNINPQLVSLYNLVRTRIKSSSRISYKSVSKAKVINI